MVGANQMQNQIAIVRFNQQPGSARRHHGCRFMPRLVRVTSQFRNFPFFGLRPIAVRFRKILAAIESLPASQV